MRKILFPFLLLLCLLYSCSEKTHPAKAAADSLKMLAEQFPKQVDAAFFNTDTASFYAFDQSPLSPDERKALVRRAIAESRIDTMGYAFFERRFDADDHLQTYEDMHNSDTGLVNGNGRVGIIITNINGDDEPDLIVRYSNGADDNGCFYFVQKNGRFQHPLMSGGHVTHIDLANGNLQKIRLVSFACCTYAFNTYTESVRTVADFKNVLQIQAAQWVKNIPALTFAGTATSRAGAYLLPEVDTDPKINVAKISNHGSLPLGQPALLGVYREEQFGGEPWLLVLTKSANHPFFYLGWIAKKDTDWE